MITPNQNIVDCGPLIRLSAPALAPVKAEPKSNMDESKNCKQFGDFNPEGGSTAPADSIRINQFENHEQFDATNGTCHSGHDPQQRNQSGIPKRNAYSLSQQEA